MEPASDLAKKKKKKKKKKKEKERVGDTARKKDRFAHHT
jgi:hypothetical protein